MPASAASSTPFCQRCGTANPPEARFCMACGAPLQTPCPACGAGNPPGARFCRRCGTALAEISLTERRVVTTLFADLARSTTLIRRMDPEAARGLLGRFFAAMREEIERCGGTVEKFIGDAVMAVFGLPAAHEDDPERAVRAAVGMQARMEALRADLGVDLRLRCGIATGEVVADARAAAEGQFMVTGDVVTFAARLQAAAPPGGILIDDRTREALRGRVICEALPQGPAEFGDHRAWRVTGLSDRPPARRLQAAMVGRREELDVLRALFRRVRDGSHGHLVTIVGPAGIGKTRLVEEFLLDARSLPHPPHILRGRCPAYGEGLTYRPLAEMLRDHFDAHASGAEAGRRLAEAIAQACAPAAGPDEARAVGEALAALVGPERPAAGRPGSLHPPAPAVDTRTADRRARAAGAAAEGPGVEAVVHAFRTLATSLARTAPVVLVVEDIQWAERSLLEFLERMAAHSADVALMVICLARPELRDRYPTWGLGVRDHTTVSLSPLTADEAARLIEAALGQPALPPEVQQAVLARAEGNPFFLGEILLMLVDEGRLVEDGSRWRWASSSPDIRIPDTVHGLVLSRLDLLAPLDKRVLQDASVVGRVFWPGAIAAVDDVGEDEVAATLQRLVERELVEERPGSALVGERGFAFTHALIREVAYGTIPKATRSERHRRLASWLQPRTPTPGDADLEDLAHHREQAWRYAADAGAPSEDLARDAVDALRRAARRAITLGALPEAREGYERALDILRASGLDADPALYAEVLTDYSDAIRWMSLPDRVLETTSRVLDLAGPLARPDLMARAWLHRAFAEYDRASLTAAEDALARARDAFRRLGDRQGEAEAYELLGIITHSLRGRLGTARVAYRTALEMFRALGDARGEARATAFLGRATLDAGEIAAARPILHEALAVARAHRERTSEARSLVGLGIVEHLAGESASCVRYFQEAVATWHKMGNRDAEAYTRRHLAMHLLRQGRVDEAGREVEAARTLLREHRSQVVERRGDAALGPPTPRAEGQADPPSLLRTLAELHLARGDLAGASEYGERSVEGLDPEDEVPHATHRATLGRIRAAQGRAQEALALFAQALEVLDRPDQEYRFDLALTLLKYGEALRVLGRRAEAAAVTGRARDLFAGMGASNFVRAAEAMMKGWGKEAVGR
ncbi:MAG: AAA family ATPase [Armatimonadota bacterium]|nr:AAA family ATPase [Armatimonadota bacterium]MDR7509670.1 AAA family ATPase [Armatimonadota bacterium]MDR7517604.1 AAA family ATPase [Armatimonadota bacterium]MDR7561493.1 AAA family ATPase [Armatimonadota bacterium]MDR7587750.1 AAA family ATPase [Armatimonadota bacterium]